MKRVLILVSMLTMLFVAGLASEPDYFIVDCNGKPGGTMYLSATGDPHTFNAAVSVSTSNINGWIYSSLLFPDKYQMPTRPYLAKEWWFSEDGLTLFMKIRQGLKWSDGEPFTLEDVRWTFEELVPEVTGTGIGGIFDANGLPPVVKIVDQETISFTWATPNALATRAIGFSDIFPKHALDERLKAGTFEQAWGLNEWDKLVVMGPYIIEDYITGERIVLKRNPYFWMYDTQGNQLPYIERIVYQIVPDRAALVLRFEVGETDVLFPTAEEYPRILSMAEEKGWKTGVGTGGLSNQFVSFNFNAVDPVKREWFRNEHFRKAIAYLIDRQSIIDTLLNGFGLPLYGPITPFSSFYNPDVEQFGLKYSVTRARLELKRGGFDWLADGTCVDNYGNRVEFELITNFNSELRDLIGVNLVSNAAKIGVKINYSQLQFNTVVERLLSGRYEGVIIGLTGSPDPGIGASVYRIDGSLHFWNYPPGYNDEDHITEENYWLPDWEERIDEIFKLQITEIDPQKRYDLFAEFQMIMAEKQPLVFTIIQDLAIYAYKNTFHPGPSEEDLPYYDPLMEFWGAWKE
ncbi:ABC transporter substrate-binding protein [Mesotoga sp.]|uniref:ABC transporter substrate-binding protein n=1 Tax=Mesotoga sp. TaxID=2053577 RepID=UPI00345E4221